jgi:hypothetical protein
MRTKALARGATSTAYCLSFHPPQPVGGRGVPPLLRLCPACLAHRKSTDVVWRRPSVQGPWLKTCRVPVRGLPRCAACGALI